MHGLRSALTPVVTQFGIDLGTLLGGAIVVENVFGLPGLGALAVTSVDNQDLPVIIGLVMLASAFIVVANIVVDLVYAFLDPRVRAGDQLKRKGNMAGQWSTAGAMTRLRRAVPQWPFISPDGRAGGFVRSASRSPGHGGALLGQRGGGIRRPLQRAATKVGLRSPQERLTLLYDAEGFGGEKTMRARVIRELIDEIRVLRSELLQAETDQDGPRTGR